MGKRLKLVCAAGLAAGLMASPALAMEGEGTSSYVDSSLSKLGRGIANVATCPFELIRTPVMVSHKDGYVAAISVGLLQGAWRTIARGVTGVFEIVTFYAEVPKGFEPLMKPEFIWANGDWVE